MGQGGWIFNWEKRSGGDGNEGAEERSVTAMCVTLCGSWLSDNTNRTHTEESTSTSKLRGIFNQTPESH